MKAEPKQEEVDKKRRSKENRNRRTGWKRRT